MFLSILLGFFYALAFFGFFFLLSLFSTYSHAYFRAKGRKKAGSRYY